MKIPVLKRQSAQSKSERLQTQSYTRVEDARLTAKRSSTRAGVNLLIPGHGGFLDRLDSFLMVSIVVYTYFIIFRL